MPRQNRMTPFGAIVAVPDRGTLTGNRGVLHDDDGRIRRAWRLKRWILCRLEFKGRKRVVMTPGRWTELFFLDEATGLAAGHRPCAECQRQRYLAYRAAWAEGNGVRVAGAEELDERLHAERIDATGSKVTFAAELDALPDGVFLTLEDDAETAHLLWRNELLAWSPGGYGARRPREPGARVNVLTPASTVAAIRAGFVPGVHPSALAEPEA